MKRVPFNPDEINPNLLSPQQRAEVEAQAKAKAAASLESLGLTQDVILGQLESTEEFPVDFDQAWKWLGYSEKSKAKRTLIAEFLAEVDFQVFAIKGENLKGGRPTEQIALTVDCFKSWAMMAQTAQGKAVRQYYLQVEKDWKRLRQQPAPVVTGTDESIALAVVAHQFLAQHYQPFQQSQPAAVAYFLAMIGQASHTAPIPLPGAESGLKAELNDAYRNLNRQGLAMNKLLKLVDRIPALNQVTQATIDNLVAALIEAGHQIGTLQGEVADLGRLRMEAAMLQAQNGKLATELADLTKRQNGHQTNGNRGLRLEPGEAN
jgi:phage anti-repressor protein